MTEQTDGGRKDDNILAQLAVRRVSDSFNEIPVEQHTTLVTQVAESLYDDAENGEARARLVRSLFNSQYSSEIRTELKFSGVPDPNDLSAIVNNPGIHTLLSTMLDYPRSYQFQLGFLLSQMPLGSLPDEIQSKVPLHAANIDLPLNSGHEKYLLCHDTEPRFTQAIKDTGVMFLGPKDDPFFMVKYYGIMTALSLRSFSNHEGRVYLQGHLFRPDDDVTTASLSQDFDSGRGRVDLKPNSWAFMRSLRSEYTITPGQFVSIAAKTARNTPDRYPSSNINVDGTEMLRSEYRETQPTLLRPRK